MMLAFDLRQAIADPGIGEAGESIHLSGEGGWQQQVIGVQEVDEIARGEANSGIARARYALVLLPPHSHRVAEPCHRSGKVIG